MNESNSINSEPVNVVRNGRMSTGTNAVFGAKEIKVENGVQDEPQQSSSPFANSISGEEINISVFYKKFIAFVDWSKKTQEFNRVNLATVNSNVKLVNSKCDKILSSGRFKRHNSAILPIMQCGDEDNNYELNGQNLRAERAKNQSAPNGEVNVERISLTSVARPRLSPVKRKESTEDEEDLVKSTNNNCSPGRRSSKRIRCMEALEMEQDLEEENKENSADAQEDANMLEINLKTLRGESKDFYSMKLGSRHSFDEIIEEYNRLGFEAKRVYNKAKKLNILSPFYGPEIKVIIAQMEDYCLSFVGEDSELSKKLEERFDLAKEMLNLEGESEDCEGGFKEEENGIIEGESFENDIEVLQYYCRVYLKKTPDKDFYTEAKRLCSRSVIFTKLAKKNNYQVKRVEKLMDEVFDKVSAHYESSAPSRELKYNLLMQNKRYKTKAKQLNYYDRFLGSKKLKMPEQLQPPPPTTPRKLHVSPIKLQLLPQLSIKKVQLNNNNKKVNVKAEENEISCGPGATDIEALLTRYNNLYKKCDSFLNDENVKNGGKKNDVLKRLHINRQTCSQLLKDAQDFERANWKEDEKVSAARMVIRGTKKISGIICDNEIWFRNAPYMYYQAETDWAKRSAELKKQCLVYQKNQLKTLVQQFLKSEEPGKDYYEDAVQLGTEVVRLNRRSMEQAGEMGNDIYKLTLRLYRNLSEFYEARASREQIVQHVQAQNKKGDTRRKILHYFDGDAKIEQLSVDAFCQMTNKKKSRLATPNSIDRAEPDQDKTETPLKLKIIRNPENAKVVSSDIRCYFNKTPATPNQDNLNGLSNIKGSWRCGEKGDESASEAESNHSEYKASTAESSEGEMEEEEEDPINESESSSSESSSEKSSSDDEEDDDDDEADADQETEEDQEALKDKKCTVYVSGLARHHTPLYMRSFLEMKRIPVLKCHILPGPKSASPSVAVTVEAIHKKIIKNLWGKTFKLTFHIH